MGLDQLEGRAHGVGRGMNSAGYQSVGFVHGHHHGTQNDVILQHGFGHIRCQAFMLSQLHHGRHVTLAHRLRVYDFQVIWQFHALGGGD